MPLVPATTTRLLLFATLCFSSRFLGAQTTTPQSQPATQPDPTDFDLGKKAFVDKNLPLSYSYFQKAADAGNTAAMYEVAVFYAKGLPNLPQNDQKALAYFQKAADAGIPDAIEALGILSFQGRGVPKDLHQAILYWEKAADAGSSAAMRNLVILYVDGKIVPKDEARALHYLQQGALRNDPTALVNLAIFQSKGMATPKDLKAALDNFIKAANLGSDEATVGAAGIYATSDPPDFPNAIVWLKKSAAAGNATSAYNVALFYSTGKPGLPRDSALALQWMHKAADLGNANAMFLLARHYASSNPPDYPATISWLKKSAAAGEVNAASMLAAAYAKGGLGITQDNALFLEWYRKAADLGDPQAIAFFHNGTPTTLAATTEPTSQSALHPLFQFTIAFAVGNQGGYITLPVTINHKDYLFMVDTGATLTVLDPSITDLGASIDTRTADTADESFKINLYHPPAMSIANQPFSIAKVAAKDLSSLRQLTGQPIMGVLGMDYLSHFIIQLDFKNQRVTFFDPTTPYAGPEPSFNLGYIHDTPVFMTDFLGIPHSVVAIDTGLNGYGGVRKTLPATLGKDAIVHHIYDRNQNINGTVTSEAFRIKKNWQLAGTTFTDLLLDPAYNNSIGLEILSDFIVTLDFPHNKLFLKSIRPNHPAPSPQFGIAPQFQNGKWIFQHLDAHDKSLGLQENDEILTVNGTPVTSLPPGQLINTDDTTLTLKIKRNSQTLELKIPAED